MSVSNIDIFENLLAYHETVLLYGAEVWALGRKEERLLDTTEMRVLRTGVVKRVALRDRDRSDKSRRDLGAENITFKATLRWYGHILQTDEGNKVKPTMKMEVRGTEAKGRPRTRWMGNIRHDMNKYGLEEGYEQIRFGGGI